MTVKVRCHIHSRKTDVGCSMTVKVRGHVNSRKQDGNTLNVTSTVWVRTGQIFF